MRVHLVTYACGSVFEQTQKFIVDTIQSQTSHEVVLHAHTYESIQKKTWFEDLNYISKYDYHGHRDNNLYCSYKIFLMIDAYNIMGDDDVVYWVDSSQHFRNGFEQNIDRLIDATKKYGMIAGSYGNDVLNNSRGDDACLHKRHVWDASGNGHLFDTHITKPHLLISWFLLAKNEKSRLFMREWIRLFNTHTPEGEPIVVQQHTAEQALFNLATYRFSDIFTFHHPDIMHDQNKDRNVVHRILNSTDDWDKYFVNLS